MRKMTLIAAVVASLAVGSALAQTGGMVASEPGKVSVADSVKATATVTAVDKATRLITLQGQDGNSFVVQAGPEYKLLGKNSLNETAFATPAVVRGSVILRTQSKLYRIAKKGAE